MAEADHQTTVVAAEHVDVQALVAAIKGSGDDKAPAKWHWVSVVGVGTFLLVPIVFWLMYMVGNALPANTKALNSVDDELEDSQDVTKDAIKVVKALAEGLGVDIESDDEEE